MIIYNNITVICDTTKRTKDRNIIVLARCHCGKEFETNGSSLRRGRIDSCGCSRAKNIAGQKFHLLTAIKKTDKRCRHNDSIVWECKCDCGTYLELSISQLTHPNRRSCGCYKDAIIQGCKDRGGVNHHWYKHGMDDANRNFRKSDEVVTFSKTVLKRDGYTCQKCSKVGGHMCAHHLNGYHWFIEGRSDINNGITLCKKCHKDFHNKYGFQNNTKEQFLEYKVKDNV